MQGAARIGSAFGYHFVMDEAIILRALVGRVTLRRHCAGFG